MDMVHARSLVGQDCFWIDSQLGLELGHGATSGSTVESSGRGSVARGKDECDSCQVPVHLSAGSLGEQDCLQL